MFFLLGLRFLLKSSPFRRRFFFFSDNVLFFSCIRIIFPASFLLFLSRSTLCRLSVGVYFLCVCGVVVAYSLHEDNKRKFIFEWRERNKKQWMEKWTWAACNYSMFNDFRQNKRTKVQLCTGLCIGMLWYYGVDRIYDIIMIQWYEMCVAFCW